MDKVDKQLDDLLDDIKNLKGEIDALGKSALKNTTQRAQLEKQALEFQRDAALEAADQRAIAERKANADIQREALAYIRTLTNAEAERINRTERARQAVNNKLASAELAHEESLTRLAELRYKKAEQANAQARSWTDQLNEQIAQLAIDTEAAKTFYADKENIKLSADKQLLDLQKQLAQTEGEIQVERSQQVAKAQLTVDNKLAEARKKHEEHLTQQIAARYKTEEQAIANAQAMIDDLDDQIDGQKADLHKWNALHSSAFESTYLKASIQAAQLKKQNEFNAKYAEALTEAQVESNSRVGKAIKKRLKEDEKAEKAKEAVSNIPLIGVNLGDKGLKISEQLNNFKKMWTNNLDADGKEVTGKGQLAVQLINGISDSIAILSTISQQLDDMVEEIAGHQSAIDTRLYGSTENGQRDGSYWRQISYDLSATMISPLIKEETLMNNVITAVEKGISKDVTQIAMLETISDKIATTFNAFDGTMRRLIRIQDANTTAARLGMEAALNELLNEMYETTEYLSDLATSVRNSLVEAEALMAGDDAVEFEYQVQKWLGSLYSVGMSDSGVSSIATALGQLASGDISGLTSGGASNLLVMAANNAGLSLSNILAEGLDSSDTNKLLSAMVEYMAELVAESNESLVVQQQLANVYGLTASDLTAATNLAETYNNRTGYIEALESYTGTYSSMVNNLVTMANSMYSRTSVGEMLNNVMSNVTYSTASGVASNAALYMTSKIADILNTFAGGVSIPKVSVMGNFVDLGLTVSDILKTTSLVGGFTSSLVSLISSIANGSDGGLTGAGLLKLVGIDTSGSFASGSSTSKSGTATVYNSSADDITDSATAQSEDETESMMASAKEESTEVTNETINENIVNIYTLLQSVVDGTGTLAVRLADQPITVVQTVASSATTGSSG